MIIIVIMLIWYEMMHNFSYEHDRLKIKALHSKIIGKIYLEPNYTNKVIKSFKKCGITTVVKDIILSIIGNFFQHCSKA